MVERENSGSKDSLTYFQQMLGTKGQPLRQVLQANRAHKIANQLKAVAPDYAIQQRGGKIRAQKQRDPNEPPPGRLIDMKPLFARSPKRKRSQRGGWYMDIPIRRYTARSKAKDSDGMSRRLYRELNSYKLPEDTNRGRIIADYLYDNRKPDSAVKELNYKPKSNEIQKIRNTDTVTKRGHRYIAFRRVSDRSHPASWLINRSSEDPDNLSDEAKRIIKAVTRYNAQQ